MGLRFSLRRLPQMLAGECVVLSIQRIWAGWVKSCPTYRWFFSLPPILNIGLVITNRRVLAHANILHVLEQDLSQWFSGGIECLRDEVVLSTAEGVSRWFGRYVEIVSHAPRRHWWRSEFLRLRIFTSSASDIRAAIARLMSTPHG